MLDLIHARLMDRLPVERWVGVAIAEDIDELRIQAGLVESGTAIVMPFRERAQPPIDLAGGFRQLVEEQYAIGIVIRIHADEMGAERARSFVALKVDLEQALAGWIPPGSPVDGMLVGGESSPIEKSVSIYVQTWAFRRFLTGGQP